MRNFEILMGPRDYRVRWWRKPVVTGRSLRAAISRNLRHKSLGAPLRRKTSGAGGPFVSDLSLVSICLFTFKLCSFYLSRGPRVAGEWRGTASESGLSSGLREFAPLQTSAHSRYLSAKTALCPVVDFTCTRGAPPSSRRRRVAALPPSLTITFFRYPKSLWYCLPLRLRQRLLRF